MKKINLTKYGFVRSRKEDITKDGMFYSAYRVDRVLIFKSVNKGTITLNMVIKGNLPIEQQLKLPSYKLVNSIININIGDIKEEELKNLYTHCVLYSFEYSRAENALIFPTKEELLNAFNSQIKKRESELKEVNEKLSSHILNLTTDDLLTLKANYDSLLFSIDCYKDNIEQLDELVNTSTSLSLINNKDKLLEDSPNYKNILKILEKCAESVD